MTNQKYIATATNSRCSVYLANTQTRPEWDARLSFEPYNSPMGRFCKYEWMDSHFEPVQFYTQEEATEAAQDWVRDRNAETSDKYTVTAERF